MYLYDNLGYGSKSNSTRQRMKKSWNVCSIRQWKFCKNGKKNDIEIITSCGVGACGICKCKIIKWAEYIQEDKISKSLSELEKDEDGNLKNIFTCIGGVKSEYLGDWKDYEIILRKNI